MTKTKIRETRKGKNVTITLSVSQYKQLLEDIEELDSIRAYDAAKKSKGTPIPFETNR